MREAPPRSLRIKETLAQLMEAARAFTNTSARLAEEHAALRASAFDRQEAIKLVAPRFLASEKAESEASATPAPAAAPAPASTEPAPSAAEAAAHVHVAPAVDVTDAQAALAAFDTEAEAAGKVAG